MKKRLWWGFGILLILALASGAWWMWGRSQGPMKVKAIAVAPISMQEEVFATGSVVPVSRQEVRVLTPGLVSKVAVKVGDSVQSGQTLVTLDSTLPDAQVAQAKANVEAAQTGVNSAQANLDELKKAQSSAVLSISSAASASGADATGSSLPQFTADQQNSIPQGNAINSSTVRQAEGALAQSKAALKQAQEALKVVQVQQSQMVYKSTIAGTVLEVNAQEGNLSSVQQPLVVLANLSQMNVESQLNEVDAGKVQLGLKVTVTSKVLGSASVQGAIAEMAPEAVAQPSVQGNSSPTVGVKISLDKVPVGLKPGSSVTIRIVVATREGVLAVPQEALFQEGNKSYVYRIQGGRLQKTDVKIGIGNDTHQEITAGLKVGELVMLNPSTEFSEGMPVTPDMGSGST